MTRYTLHVPLQLNDGSDTPAFELHEIEKSLLHLVGGFTATDGAGSWLDDEGQLYREPVRLYATDTDADIRPELLGLAQSIAARLGQLAVYVTAQDVTTWLVEPEHAEEDALSFDEGAECENAARELGEEDEAVAS